jgi:hypothetical protein
MTIYRVPSIRDWLPGIPVQGGLFLSDFFLHDFALMWLEALHDFSILCDKFHFNRIWHTRSIAACLVLEASRNWHHCYVCGLITLVIQLLTPWSRVLLQKLTGFAASQEIPRIYGIRKFITVLRRARHLFLSWARSIQSPQPPLTSWRSLLIYPPIYVWVSPMFSLITWLM